MSESKHFDRIAIISTALILVLTLLFMNGASLGIEAMPHTMGYENRLFDRTRVHTIDIVMDDWDELIANATSEEYYAANVVIDGESYKNVGIRTKGNTSLSTVATLGSERYSFKIEFDHYDSTKSYHGLDKLSLNNLIQDSTMMKDYLTYTLMNEFGVNSSMCSYVYITVNGEDWGLYLAVEGVEEAFLERNYGSNSGELYKPDSMSFGGGRGNGANFDMGDFGFDFEGADSDSDSSGEASGGFDPSAMSGGGMPNMPSAGEGTMPGESPSFDTSEGSDIPEGFEAPQDFDIPEDFDPSAAFGGRGGGFGGGSGMGSSDVKLQYIDDDPDSYSNIWNNAKTNITQADQTRLIESLKKLSNNEDIESVVDVEQGIRYFVVHNFVCNDDSYTGMMVHNYYLYEKDGRLAMIPWDYNLGFGTFSAADATDVVNTPIDAPVSGGSGEDRPMWYWIVANETYTELYHQYFAEFLSSVDIQGIINEAYELIKPYVEKDPTAFFSYEEFELGVDTLRQFCALRSESISMQLENGETASDMGYVDASAITLSNMGTMNGGAGGFGRNMPGMTERPANFERTNPVGSQSEQSSANTAISPEPRNQQASTALPSEGAGDSPSDLPEDFSGELPEDFNPSSLPEGFDPSNLPGNPSGSVPAQSSEGTPESEAPEKASEAGETSGTDFPFGGNMPSGGDFAFDGNRLGSGAPGLSGWIWIAASAIVLVIGLIVARKYKS